MFESGVFSFDWDTGNIAKVQKRFSLEEVEEFFTQTLNVKEDLRNSVLEKRFIAIGLNSAKRPMFVSFTIRGTKNNPLIRVISCRLMHKREALKYEIFKENHKKEQ